MNQSAEEFCSAADFVSLLWHQLAHKNEAERVQENVTLAILLGEFVLADYMI